MVTQPGDFCNATAADAQHRNPRSVRTEADPSDRLDGDTPWDPKLLAHADARGRGRAPGR